MILNSKYIEQVERKSIDYNIDRFLNIFNSNKVA